VKTRTTTAVMAAVLLEEKCNPAMRPV